MSRAVTKKAMTCAHDKPQHSAPLLCIGIAAQYLSKIRVTGIIEVDVQQSTTVMPKGLTPVRKRYAVLL